MKIIKNNLKKKFLLDIITIGPLFLDRLNLNLFGAGSLFFIFRVLKIRSIIQKINDYLTLSINY
jgi:hypothetical protein